MFLRDWIKTNKMTYRQFGYLLGVNDNVVKGWCRARPGANRKQLPRNFVEAIKRITGATFVMWSSGQRTLRLSYLKEKVPLPIDVTKDADALVAKMKKAGWSGASVSAMNAAMFDILICGQHEVAG